MASSLSSITLHRSASDGALLHYKASETEAQKAVAIEVRTPTSFITELLQEAEILSQHHCSSTAQQILNRIPQFLPREHQVSRDTSETQEIVRKIQHYRHLLNFLRTENTPVKDLNPLEKKLKAAEVLAKHIHFDRANPLFLEVKDQLKEPRDLPQSLLYVRCLLGLTRVYLQTSQETADLTHEAIKELETAYNNASSIDWEERSVHEIKEVYGQLQLSYSILHTRMAIEGAKEEDYHPIEHRLTECESVRNALLNPQLTIRRIDANKLPVSRVPASGSVKSQKV